LKDGEAVEVDIGQGGKDGMLKHRGHMAKACHGIEDNIKSLLINTKYLNLGNQCDLIL
jgi:hypothetical protein